MASLSAAKADVIGPLRAVFRIATLILLLLLMLPLHGLWRLLRLPSPWPRLFLGRVAALCGAAVMRQGKALRHDVLFVANHVSWVDIPVLAGATGTAFVAHEGIAKWPLIGWLASLNNTIFVARADRLSVAGQIDTLREALDARQPIAIFPEGTTTDGTELLAFKPALFEVVVPPPKPMMVQPLLLDYGPSSPQVAWVGDEPALANAWRLLVRPDSFPIRIDFLDPFDPTDFADRKAIAAEARRRILRAASARAPGIV